MQTFRIETIIAPNRVLTVNGVPFRVGERVEVIVIPLASKSFSDNPYPLRGKPFRLLAPFDSVAENEWAVLK